VVFLSNSDILDRVQATLFIVSRTALRYGNFLTLLQLHTNTHLIRTHGLLQTVGPRPR
jgi:hypothetical protein